MSDPPIPDPTAGPDSYPTDQFARVVAAVRALDHPTQIDRYFIQNIIGEGGMGTVYKAEQREPIQRIVALKVIKLGMDTREVIARFETERQSLALMNHPNVARVLDAGATDTGRPYFVMEYVDGEPITTFADRRRLTVRERLELFRQACDAIEHAHQKAILHRDLKPSNILVSQEADGPRVKVIDFGVAKAIDQLQQEKQLVTEVGRFVGTPEYMSPEQAGAGGRDVDTRSDVYSLGVVLYELLSGMPPYDARSLRSAGYDEIRRIIREVDPPRPSTQLSSLGRGGLEIADRRQMPLRDLSDQLKRELELIPLKAMRKERAHRYASAAELSEDIQNYLASRPLRAMPESRLYIARKFMRRNRSMASVVGVMALLLACGIGATIWQAVRATRAEAVARQQRDLARDASDSLREVNHFLTDDLLIAASPEISLGREMSVRDAVDRAAETVGKRLSDRPLTQAAVRSALADTYKALGLSEQALVQAQAALGIYQRECGPNDSRTFAALISVGDQLIALDRQDDAERLLREATGRATRVLGRNVPVVIDLTGALAHTLRVQEKFAEAEPLLRSVVENDRQMFGPQSEQLGVSLNNLAVMLNTQRRTAEAEPVYREAMQIKRLYYPADHPSILVTQGNYARVLWDLGKRDAAIDELRQVLAVKRRVLKDDHPGTLLAMNNLGSYLGELGQFDEAERLLRECVERRTRVLGAENLDTLQSMTNLGNTLTRSGRPNEAEGILRQAMAGRTKVLGETHPLTIGAKVVLARSLYDQSKFAEALPLLAWLCEPDHLSKGPPTQQAGLLARYGACLAKQQTPLEAEPVLLRARDQLTATDQATGDLMRLTLGALASVCDRTNRPAEAAGWREALSAIGSTQPTTTQGSPAINK